MKKPFRLLKGHSLILYELSLKTKKPTPKSRLSLVVQAERLELSHLAALDPKSSMSTNSITPASKSCSQLLQTGCKYKVKIQFPKYTDRKKYFSFGIKYLSFWAE